MEEKSHKFARINDNLYVCSVCGYEVRSFFPIDIDRFKTSSTCESVTVQTVIEV